MNIFRKRVTPVIPTISRRVVPWTPRSPIMAACLAVLCFWLAVAGLVVLIGWVMT